MRKQALLALFLLAALPLGAAEKKEKSASLDVKDEDVRVVLQSLKEQCGVKNLVIDRDVQGRATFYFVDVPCRTAFDVVFRTFGLKAEILD